jgi:NAD(P)H-hydrate epimerase
MGWSESTTEFIGRLLLHGSPTELPTVVDADGLNNLSGLNNWWRRMPRPTVVTPHPGEMATLSKTSASDVQQDRVKSAQHWSRKWGITVVLKGANTIIAAPDGPTRVSPFANPGLASGGTGDVLTGIIGGLMAQGLTPELAGCCGVYIHGRAGEVVTQELGDAGTLATDLIEHLPDSIKWLENAAKPF